jgi:translation initiation factor IF-1
MKPSERDFSKRLQWNSADSQRRSLKTGEIREILPNGLYVIRTLSGSDVIAHLDKSMRSGPVRLLIGDRVQFTPSQYHPSRGTIFGRDRD